LRMFGPKRRAVCNKRQVTSCIICTFEILLRKSNRRGQDGQDTQHAEKTEERMPYFDGET